MTTLDEISKQVESLRAEVEALKARPPSIVVNRGDEIAVTGLDLLKSQVLLKVEATPEPAKPSEPQPIDGKVGEIYEWDGKKWRLTKWAPAPHSSTFIVNSSAARSCWDSVSRRGGAHAFPHDYRWHVEEVAEPAPPNPKCPACGGEMQCSLHGRGQVCQERGCGLIGPINDPTGEKVRKLRNIDKLPKVTVEQLIDKWCEVYSSYSGYATAMRVLANHFAGHIIVASKPTKGE